MFSVLEAKCYAHCVGAANLVGIGKFVFLVVEQVVGVEEHLSVVDWLVTYLEVHRESVVEFLFAI